MAQAGYIKTNGAVGNVKLQELMLNGSRRLHEESVLNVVNSYRLVRGIVGLSKRQTLL